MASRRLLSTTQLLRTTTTAGSNNQQRDGDPSSALVVGNTAVGVRDNHPYIYRRSELIGKLFPRMRPRSDAGDVLALLDVCAGRGAYFFLKTFKCGGRYRVENGLSMATISFNSFTFSQAIFEGDMLLFESRVIHTGNTTIGLHISVKRQAYDCPVPSYIGESYVTMVIVDANDLTKIVPGHIPAVRLTDPEDIKRHAKYNLLVQNAKALLAKQTHKHANLPAPDGIRSKRQLTVEEVELPQNATKPRKLSMRDTRIVCEQSFSNEHVNTNNAIFGGDILQFMEKAALHCGRVFAQYSRVFALGMMGMTFNSPIFLDDLVRCSAQVACVRGSTMLVNVRIDAEQEGKHRMTNQAAFILVSLDPEGVPVEIPCGINLEGATQAELGAYATARHIMEHSSKHRVKV